MKAPVSFLFLLFAHIARATSANQNSGWGLAPIFSKIKSLIINLPLVGQANSLEQDELAKKFYKAIINNDTSTAKSCLDEGLDPNYQYQFKANLLFLACFTGNVEIVELLISKEARVNEIGPKNVTPINMMCARENVKIVRLLIDHVDFSITGPDGLGALHVASMSDSPEILNLLIEKQAPLNAKDSSENTPLMLAVLRNKRNNVKILIKAGADLSIEDSSGKTPLYRATDRKIIKYLKDPTNIDKFDLFDVLSDALEQIFKPIKTVVSILEGAGENIVEKAKIPILIIFTTVLANEALGGALGNKLWQIIEDISKPSPVKQKNLLEKVKTKIASFKFIQYSNKQESSTGEDLNTSDTQIVSTLLAEIPTNDDQSSIL